MRDLQAELDLAYIFNAHDLAIVRHVAHRIAVMYLGRFVEVGARETLYSRPRHTYRQALLSAAPIADPEGRATRRCIIVRGEPPNPSAPPTGRVLPPEVWYAVAHSRERDHKSVQVRCREGLLDRMNEAGNTEAVGKFTAVGRLRPMDHGHAGLSVGQQLRDGASADNAAAAQHQCLASPSSCSLASEGSGQQRWPPEIHG